MKLSNVRTTEGPYGSPVGPAETDTPSAPPRRGPMLYLNERTLEEITELDGVKAGDFLRLEAVVKVKRVTSTSDEGRDGDEKRERSVEIEFFRLGFDADPAGEGMRGAAWADDDDEDDAGGDED